MSLEAARIFVTVGANTGPFAKGMAGATAGVNGFAAKTQTKLGATGGFIKKWGAKAALGVAAVGIAASSLSLGFEDSMTEIEALVGASDKQMAMYERRVLGMAKTLPQGPKALADALYFVTSSGFEGAAALKVLEASARASAAGLGSTAIVADAVTSAVNAYGPKVLSAARATDILLATVREGKAEPEELAGAIGRVISPAQTMGVTFEEVGGILASLSLVGLDAAEGVTALRGVLTTILKPSKMARKFLKETGESIAGIRKEIKDKGLLPTMTRLAKKFKGNQDAIGTLFPNVRALNGFLAVTGKNSEKTARAVDGVTNSVGDVDAAFVAASESAGFKLRKAWSSIQTDLIGLGNVIVPVFANIASHVSGLAQKFGELPAGAQKLLIIGAIAVAALGPVITIAGNVVLALDRIGQAAGFLAAHPGLIALGLIAGVAFLLANKFGLLRGKTDETKAAFDRAKFAAEGYKNALDRLKGTADGLVDAQLAERASTLALQRAKVTASEAVKNFGKNSLEAKEAVLGVEIAQRDLARAVSGVTTAQGKNDRARADHLTGLNDTRAQLENLRGKYASVNQELRNEEKAARRAGATIGSLNDITRSNNAARFASDVRALVKSLGGAGTSAGAAAQEVAEFVEKTGRIPSKREMKVIADTGNATALVQRLRDRAGSPVYMPVIVRPVGTGGVQPRAVGGPVTRGRPYLVGERGPELFIPDRTGAIMSSRDTFGDGSPLATATSGGSSRGGGTTIVLNVPRDAVIVDGEKLHRLVQKAERQHGTSNGG